MKSNASGFTCGIDVKRWLLEFERTVRPGGAGAAA
jgi:O6-methylguanine-DNA--protein-cysteine methyltransferase